MTFYKEKYSSICFWLLEMTFLYFCTYDLLFRSMSIVKFRNYEKAKKFEKNLPTVWQNSCFYSVASK